MKELLFVLLALLNIGQLFAQNPIRLKYRLLFQSSNNVLNNYATDSSVSFYPAALTILADENINYNKTLATQSYDSTSKTIFTYDQNGNIIREVRMRRMNGGPWENFFKQERLFDSNGRLLDYSFFSWMNGLWKETRFTTWGYNNAGLEILRIEKDTIAGILTNRDFHATTYDTLNRKTLYSWQKWVNGNWQFYKDDVYHYKGNMPRLDSVEHKEWDTNISAFKKLGRSLFVYNGQGQLVQQIIQSLQNGTFINSALLEYGYDNAGNRNATVSFSWDNTNNSWRPSSGDYFTFDAQGRTIENVFKQVDNTTNQLKNVGRTQTTFGSDSSLIVQTGANWINDTWVVLYKNEWVFERVAATSVEDFSAIVSNVKAYPNPFTNNTIIDLKTTQPAEANICVSDITGRLVYSNKQFAIAGDNSFVWEAVDKNGNALPAGMYLLSVFIGEKKQSIQLIKQ